MQTDMFFLYSTKMSGWLTDGGNYVDDIDLAGKFNEPQAATRVKNHYDKHSKQFMLIPVLADILAMRS